MRRILSLILVLILCMSLCACGGTSGKNKFVGIWKGPDVEGYNCTITFKSNGTYIFEHDKYDTRMGNWEVLDSDTIVAKDEVTTFTFNLSDGILKGTCNSWAGSPMTLKKAG